MKLTTPNDTVSMSSDVEELLTKFELEFKSQQKDQAFYQLIVDGEYSEFVCNTVAKMYESIGWRNVTCRCTGFEKTWIHMYI